jgi:hypothetical protein
MNFRRRKSSRLAFTPLGEATALTISVISNSSFLNADVRIDFKLSASRGVCVTKDQVKCLSTERAFQRLQNLELHEGRLLVIERLELKPDTRNRLTSLLDRDRGGEKAID